MSEISAPSSSRVKCEICDTSFYKFYNLKRHMLRIHGIDEQEFNQNISYSTQKNSYLNQKNSYLNQKNGNPPQKKSNMDIIPYENPLQCNKCLKVFSTNWYLLKHSEKCKGCRDHYKCEYCDSTFNHSKSRFRHYKTCKDKIESEAKNVTIKNHCQEANVINNIENQNNHTQNIILVYKPENMEFIKDHIGESALEYIKKVYPRIDRRIMMDYSKRILDLPVNRCIKKEDLRSGHSDVYLGDNKWEKTTDKHVYPELACSLANDMSSYINERRSKLKKEVFEKVIGFIDYMSEEGYINIDDKEVKRKILKEFRLFVKELKMVVFNKQD